MPDSNNNINKDTNTSNNIGGNISEPQSRSLVNKNQNIRIVTTLLGMILMLGFVALGIVIVLQPQLFEQKAGTIAYNMGTCNYNRDCLGLGICLNHLCVPFVTLTPITGCESSNGMIYLSQSDPRWRDEPVQRGACDFEYIGCAPSVIASVVSTKQRTCFSPYEVSRRAISRFTCNGVGANASAGVLHQLGVATTRIEDSNDPTVMRNNIVNSFLSTGRPVLVGVQIIEPGGYSVQHVTLMVGYNQQTGRPIFNDPLFGANMELESNGYTINWATADAHAIN